MWEFQSRGRNRKRVARDRNQGQTARGQLGRAKAVVPAEIAYFDSIAQHQAIAHIAIVGNGKQIAACVFFIGGHVVPQFHGVIASCRGEGAYLFDPLKVIALRH